MMWKWKRSQGASEASRLLLTLGMTLLPSLQEGLVWPVMFQAGWEKSWGRLCLILCLPNRILPSAIEWSSPKLAASAAQWLMGELGWCSW